MRYLQSRKFVWLDPITWDEKDFQKELSKGKSWYELLAEQTTYGRLEYNDGDVVVVATEINEDNSPREVLILPREVIVHPKRLRLLK